MGFTIDEGYTKCWKKKHFQYAKYARHNNASIGKKTKHQINGNKWGGTEGRNIIIYLNNLDEIIRYFVLGQFGFSA